MKKKYYLLSFIAPMLLLFIASTICGYVPFGEYTFNISDAYYQYPTFLLELGRMLREGSSIFYTLHAGMGVNFFSILNLYGGSPLNLFSVFFDNTTIYIFYTLLIYVKLGLAGLTMNIYLNSLNTKYKNTIWNVIFSLIYATSGWVIAMSMHIMWLDAYILLPLVIKGLDALILEGKYLSYTLFLALAIIINYYTGFMLCMFMVIYFVYKTLTTNIFNKKTILRFIIFSIVAALISCVILIPTIFNLLGGRFSNLDFSFDYLSVDWYQAISSIYNMTIGSFITEDHLDYGTTILYITIFALVLLICYFFNKKISRKNKIITLAVILFFHLSFAIPLFDYAWNMFQKPIWWEHRYQFVFVFFLLIIAYQSFCTLENVKITPKAKSFITIGFMILLTASFSYKVKGLELSNSRVLFILVSIILFYIYLLSKRQKYLIFLIILELGLNAYTPLNINQGFKYEEIKDINNKTKEILNIIDDSDYRTTTFTYADAGLAFGFNSAEIFSSSNNARVMNYLYKLNATAQELNMTLLQSYNPAVFSLLSIKYMTSNSNYYPCQNGICINEYALPMMYSVNKRILDVTLTSNFQDNINNIYSTLLNRKVNLFYDIPINVDLENVEVDDKGEFYNAEENFTITIKAKADKECLIVFNKVQIVLQKETTIYLNDEKYTFEEGSDYLIKLKENDEITIIYQYKKSSLDPLPLDSHSFTALDTEVYESAIKEIKEKTNYRNIEDNDYILKGEVEVNDDLLLINIPYDEGLTIKVDGKETEYFKVLDTLIDIDVEKGIHTVEITYFPKGLKSGSLISIISLLTLLIYTKIKNRKKKIS